MNIWEICISWMHKNLKNRMSSSRKHFIPLWHATEISHGIQQRNLKTDSFYHLREINELWIWATNVSSVVEFQRWWVLKSKIFGQESTYSKDFFFKSVNELRFIKKWQNCTFNWIKKKKKSFKNISLGDHFLLQTFFSRLHFRTTLLSKIMPNFWWTDIPRRIF